ncbi:MAG: cob(I)yrinic acid a,c-diamide adenosyltransferase [Pseudomonadales bacterium]|jgi:cob(I)alamin adenosyltransferase|nr:cob(I)yrinic acid a,c-diamide adenosyltransferase [Pseudomonadales bacterium]
MSRDARFNQAMRRQQAAVQARIAQAPEERSLLLLLTGDGKGKTTSGFGMLWRALGYGQNVAVVQFIKGTQASGEELFLRQRHPGIPFFQMGTGFTWDTQNFAADQAAARRTWAQAAQLLQQSDLDFLLLDELTYMLAYRFLEEDAVLTALRERSPRLSVVITGRGGGSALRELCDTVSEVKNLKHAFDAGLKARQGIDY